jgi:excisionase family DNA binding protein
MKDDSDVLSAREAAIFLRAHMETLRRLARRGEIPALKLGKDWRFSKEALLRWADEQRFLRRKATVLIVDDELDVAVAMSRMVERAGFRARIATTGSEGLEVVSRETPDMILLDLMMPEMSGSEFLREIRRTHPDIPVAIVTGYPDGELMRQAAKYGPLMLLTKPIDRAQLESMLQMALGQTADQGANAGLSGRPGNG